MGHSLFVIVRDITILIYLVGVYYSYKKTKLRIVPFYLRLLFWYFIAGSALGVIFILSDLKIVEKIIASRVNLVSVLIRYMLHCYIIFQLTKKNLYVKIMMIAILISLIYAIFFTQFPNSIDIAFPLCNASLFLFCGYYFYFLFKNPPKIDLKINPGFIICSGIFLGCGLAVPFNFISKYLNNGGFSKDALFSFAAFSSCCFIIMNLFFIKALSCLKQQE